MEQSARIGDSVGLKTIANRFSAHTYQQMKHNVLCIFTLFQTGRAVPIVVQIMAWLSASLAVMYVMGMVFWGMFNSQRKRIEKAMKGTKGNVADKLGFMNKVKTEVTMSI